MCVNGMFWVVSVCLHGCRRVFAAACAVAYLSLLVLRCVTGCLVGGMICVYMCGCIVLWEHSFVSV